MTVVLIPIHILSVRNVVTELSADCIPILSYSLRLRCSSAFLMENKSAKVRDFENSVFSARHILSQGTSFDSWGLM